MTNERPLVGQSAVVTGSSSGIGRAIAHKLAESGADVLIHGRENRQGAQETCEMVRSRGRQSQIVLADLSASSEQDRLVDEAWNWRPIDIWVNNAGADILTDGAWDQSFEDRLEALWRVDVVATLRLARAVGQRMRARSMGTIINMGWDQAETGMAGESGELFGAAKGAVMAASRSLAKSLAPEVRVNCLAPGWIRTKWGSSAPPEWEQRAKDESLMNRWGEPGDVADVVVLLATATFINGQVIAINGGRAN